MTEGNEGGENMKDEDKKKVESYQIEKTVPTLANMRSEEGYITVDFLAEIVPKIHAVEAAQKSLENDMNLETFEELSKEERKELNKIVDEGEDAKRRLVLAALPLIKDIVGNEFKKREDRGANISYDDMLAEGVVGLLKGIKGYKVEASVNSATNYLGQWIITEIKRGTERYDHAFSVPYETADRNKKIRAIRSRLQGELNREPSDEEIVEAWDDRSWRGGQMLGPKASTKEKTGFGQNKTKRNSITVKHVQEERQFSSRTGQIVSRDMTYDGSGDRDNATISEIFQETSITNEEETHNENEVDEKIKSDALSALFFKTKEEAGIQDQQFDIIARRFGLSPYYEVHTLKQISQATSLTQSKVSSVITAFQKVMVTPNGVFHKLVSELNEDELEALNLGWVSQSLGEYVINKEKKTPSILRSQKLI